MVRKYLIVFMLLTFLIGCATARSKEDGDLGSKPVIVDKYASETVRPGAIWRIFIQAEDADNDMKDIFTTISAGTHSFPKYTFTPIRRDNRTSLEGYLYVSTPVSSSLISEKYTVTLFVRDKAGNASETVVFPLLFSNTGHQAVPGRWQSATNTPLGGVFTDYFRHQDRRLKGNAGFDK